MESPGSPGLACSPCQKVCWFQMVPWSLPSSITSVVDLWHFGTDPNQDPDLQISTADLRIRFWILLRTALFVSDLHRKSFFFPTFCCLLLFKGTFTSLIKNKKPERSHKTMKNHGFSYYFCLMMEGSLQIMMDLDTDSRGPKTYRSGSTVLSVT